MKDLKTDSSAENRGTTTELFYTPTVEDFHVGLRYEYCDNYHDMNPSEPDGDFWRKYVLPNDVYFEEPPCPFGYYQENKPMTHFRIKYLDRQDIEELGWEFWGENKDPQFVTYRHSGGYKMVVSEKGFHIFSTNLNGSGKETLFFGEIKCYNELKKLMIQLNIL